MADNYDDSDPLRAYYSLSLAGGTLTAAEQKGFLKYAEKSSADYSRVKTAKERVAKMSAKILKKYPNVAKNLESALSGEDLQDYEKIKTSDSEVRPGDVCINGFYEVRVPDEKTLDEAVRGFRTHPSTMHGLGRVTSYVYSVYEKMPHMFADMLWLSLPLWSSPDNKTALDVAWHNLYQNKEVPLEKILSEEMPGVCFEQSIVLNYLLSSDSEIKKLGGKSRMVWGTTLTDESFGQHMWVSLEFGKDCPDRELAGREFMLDASCAQTFVFSKQNSNSRRRYIAGQAYDLNSDSIGILRPKQAAVQETSK